MRNNSSILDILSKHASYNGERQAFVFLSARKQEHSSLTFEQLYFSAQNICSNIQARVASGDRVALVYNPGLEFIVALLACWFSGAVAVPMVPEHFRKIPQSMHVLLRNISAKIILCDSASENLLTQNDVENCINTSRLAVASVPATTSSAAPTLDDLALIQYTSGSTESPKGVMITHGNLMANLEMIRARFKHNAESTVAGWLPFYHDQGLVGNILQPLYVGAKSVLMSPKTFIRDPMLWIQTISDYRVQSSGGPNFAYQLCISKHNPARLQDVDLSTWSIAFNGAEPVRTETVNQFSEIYSRYGFRPQAMYTCYGLAEATLFASGGTKLQSPVFKNVERAALQNRKIIESETHTDNSQVLTACGTSPIEGVIKIVNPQNKRPCKANEIGEIWLAGPHIAKGYWNNVLATKTQFGATLDNNDETTYLRTGDLGFLDNKDQLYVTGRIKELIIRFGKNYYPADLEATMAEAHPSLEPGRGVVFFTDYQGKDEVVAVQELKRNCYGKFSVAEITKQIRNRINEIHALTLNRILIVTPNTIPLTTSGKKKRNLIRQQYELGEINKIGETVRNDDNAKKAFS